MARTPIPIGGYGAIKVTDLTPRDADGKRVGPKSVEKYEARCRWRDKDGTFKRLRFTADTAARAIAGIQARAAELAAEIRRGEIDGSTRFSAVADAWFEEDIVAEIQLGHLAFDTGRLYRGCLDNHILPAIGHLRAGTEVQGSTLERLVKGKRDKVGFPTAKTIRSVLKGVCRYAVRHGAMTDDPSASIGRLAQGDKPEIRALTLAERKDLIAGLERVAVAHRTDKLGRSLGTRAQVWADLPDLVEAMLTTGVRIGELLALTGPNFTRTEDGRPVVSIEAHIVREHGQLVRKRYRKGSKHILILGVPEWSVPMWTRRKLASGLGPMFASITGGWIHPDNMGHRIREAFDEAGFPWLRSHGFRKTVAAILDEDGLSSRHIADQLGHANEATARKFYIAPRVGNPQSAAALEAQDIKRDR